MKPLTKRAFPIPYAWIGAKKSLNHTLFSTSWGSKETSRRASGTFSYGSSPPSPLGRHFASKPWSAIPIGGGHSPIVLASHVGSAPALENFCNTRAAILRDRRRKIFDFRYVKCRFRWTNIKWAVAVSSLPYCWWVSAVSRSTNACVGASTVAVVLTPSPTWISARVRLPGLCGMYNFGRLYYNGNCRLIFT